MKGIYAGDISFLDSQIGRIFEFLSENDMLDDTILIITSDHGENFGEHGYIEHQFTLHNTLLHVPLIIRYPKKIRPGLVVNERVSTIFLFSTILDLLDIPAFLRRQTTGRTDRGS